MGQMMLILALILALMGLSLIWIEFFLPSGFLIFSAVFLLLGSVVSFGFLGWGVGWTVVYGLSMACMAIVVIALALRRIRNQVALKNDQRGFQAAEVSLDYKGQVGIAISDLRPSGYIEIHDHQLQAQSDRGYVDRGASVQVVEIRGSTLVVKVIK